MNDTIQLQPELFCMLDGTPIKTQEEWALRRTEILRILSEEEYGITPPPPASVTGCVTERNAKCCCGHAVLETIDISFDTPKGTFHFPVRFFCPTKAGKYPLFLLLNFRPDVYDCYLPSEEIIDNGFAVATVCYKDITADNCDFESGIAAHYPREDENTAWGKIGMWAFCASRMVDYFWERPEIDTEQIAVIGHSRLGKTALWCGAQDPRIRYVISNDSGCSGAAYERIKHDGAETINDILKNYPQWFCKNYHKYRHAPEQRAFDQHFLLSLIAPRYVAIGSAEDDRWADPYSEQLSCIGASPAWAYYGLQGYVGETAPAKCGDVFCGGQVQYHLRDGIHFLGRADWLVYMDMVRKVCRKTDKK